MSVKPQGPNVIHPEKPSAVGSRNSLNRNNRNEYTESKYVIDEEVDKVLNHLNSKLPPEVLSKLHISSTVKELLHNYFNQGMQNMLNRYLTTVEDEMAKKFRDFVDNEEQSGLNRYTPVSLPKLLNEIGGEDKFNTAELEKSIVNIYGHLQGHMQRGQYELEQETNDILRHRADVGAFIRGENIHSVIKCAFVDSLSRPDNVSDIILSVNILDDELISPIYHYLVSPAVIVGRLVSDTIINYLDREIVKIDDTLLDEGKEVLTYNEQVFEKIKTMGRILDSTNQNLAPESQGDSATKILLLGKKILQIVKGVPSDVSKLTSNPVLFSNNVTKLLNEDFVRNRGFSTAVNAITAILDTSKMGYQYIENNKNARQLIIREYEDTENLPDECYEIHANYLDMEQLRELRITYVQQFEDFETQAQKIWDVCNQIYQEEKKRLQFIDYDVVKKEFLNTDNKKSFWSSISNFLGVNHDDDNDEEDRIWDEVTFIEPTPTDVEKTNNSFQIKQKKVVALLENATETLNLTFGKRYPTERVCIEDKIMGIKGLFYDFIKNYNPFHAQPGLNMQINLRTIKRKQTTMKSMSNVLNEFFFSISDQFQDKAFADFKRRRSTDTTALYEEFITQHDNETNET